MTVSERSLRESARAVVGADGRARAVLQPLRAFEVWEINRISVTCTSTTLTPTCRIYSGHEALSQFIEGTYSGNQDSTDTTMRLENGEALLAVWEGKVVGSAGADVGATCMLTIQGKAIRDAF